MSQLQAVMEFADRLTARDIYQEPFALDQDSDIPGKLLEAAAEGFTHIFVDDGAGIRRWLLRESLDGESGWPDVVSVATEVPVDRRVTATTPIFHLLELFEVLPSHDAILAVEANRKVIGVVTPWDLNRPGARLFGFGLCLVVEGEIARLAELEAIRQENGDAARAKQRMLDLLDRHDTSGARRYRGAEAQDQQLEPLAYATFNAVITIARKLDVFAAAAELLGAASERALLHDVRLVQAFRNDVAHVRRDRLADPLRVLSAMKLAHRLAHQLAALEADS